MSFPITHWRDHFADKLRVGEGGCNKEGRQRRAKGREDTRGSRIFVINGNFSVTNWQSYGRRNWTHRMLIITVNSLSMENRMQTNFKSKLIITRSHDQTSSISFLCRTSANVMWGLLSKSAKLIKCSLAATNDRQTSNFRHVITSCSV